MARHEITPTTGAESKFAAPTLPKPRDAGLTPRDYLGALRQPYWIIVALMFGVPLGLIGWLLGSYVWVGFYSVTWLIILRIEWNALRKSAAAVANRRHHRDNALTE